MTSCTSCLLLLILSNQLIPLIIVTMKVIFWAVIAYCSIALGELIGVPTVPFTASGSGTYEISKTDSIIVNNHFANVTDTEGWTLLPPTLSDFTSTFAQDFNGIANRAVQVQSGDDAQDCSIFLTLDNSTDYVDAAGRWTSEAYTLDVQPDRITISGASPLGVWWGTRSLLQQIVLNNGSIPIGSGIDSPGWNTRGIFVRMPINQSDYISTDHSNSSTQAGISTQRTS